MGVDELGGQKVISGHVTHAVRLAAEKVPPGQGEHDMAAAAEISPGGHGAQSRGARGGAALNEPAAQIKGVPSPGHANAGEQGTGAAEGGWQKLPIGHTVHVALPVALSAKKPAAHAEQLPTEPDGATEPGAHATHTPDTTSARLRGSRQKWPAGHAAEPTLKALPAGQALSAGQVTADDDEFMPATGQKKWAGQSVHVVPPTTSEIVPGGQGAHATLATTLAYVPGAHRRMASPPLHDAPAGQV